MSIARQLRWLPLLSVLALPLAGCHSAFVQATVTNRSGATIHLFEVDYPNASFGSEELAAGADFKYRFKILGNGPTKVIWTDASQHEHTVKGPDLQEGQEGTLAITLAPDGVAHWEPNLQIK